VCKGKPSWNFNEYMKKCLEEKDGATLRSLYPELLISRRIHVFLKTCSNTENLVERRNRELLSPLK